MPRMKEFKLEEIKDADYKALLSSMLEDKMKKCSVFGAISKSTNCRVWGISISDEDFKSFKESKKAYDELKKRHNNSFKNKKQKYDSLKAKCDFCLHDVEPYKKLVKNIDSFTYCGAINELEVFEKRYLKSNGYTKAVYRARLQEFSKVSC